MDLHLQGARCLVTGASAGIGRSTALALGEEGALVAVVARRRHLLGELADEFERRQYHRPLIIVADVLQIDAAQRIETQVIDEFGRLDVLVNNAGGSRPLRFDAPEDAWAEAMDLNYTAARRLTQAVLPQMLKRGSGRIINVTGSSEPRELNGAHPGTAATHAWAKGLSREVAASGITVNSIAPGHILSEQSSLRLHPTEESRRSFADMNIPAGHLGEPEDIARLVAFIASPLGRYITGEVIHVDGGLRRFAH